MLTDHIEVVINYESCFDYDLCVIGRPLIPSPKPKFEKFDVYGTSGSYYDIYGYEDIEYVLTFNYLEEIQDKGSFKTNFRQIKRWLFNGSRLEFSDESDVYYVIKKVEISDAENDIIEYGKFEVSFTLAPFAYVIENSPLIFNMSGDGIDASFDNISSINSNPVIVLHGSGSASVFLNEKRLDFVEIIDTIVIDCDLKITYKSANGVNINQAEKQSSSDYFQLIPGINKLVVTGKNITQVDVWRNALV